MSTVHIRLKDIFDVAVACHVIFYPGDTPFFSGSALAVSGPHSILIDEDGEGSVTLLPGRYTVRFAKITGNTDTLIILVPNEEGTYELQDLVCAGDWVLPFRDFLKKSQNLADVADKAAAFAGIKQPASETASGVIELATQAEADAGTDASRAVTPATLAQLARWSSVHPRLKLVSVLNASERLSLEALNLGDWVEQTDTRAIYQVLDPERPALEASYVEVGLRAAPPETGSSGLQAEWRFAAGSELADSSGNGRTLSINNAGPAFSSIDGRRAMVISASTDNAQSGVIEAPGPLTIAVWARSNLSSGYPVALAWSNLSFYCYHANMEAPTINFDYGGMYGASAPNTGGWIFFSARFDGALWKYSIGDETFESDEDPALGINTYQPWTVIFGKDGFTGAIGAVRIWNEALNDTELAQIKASNP